MAGDWMKVEVALPDKPEVWAIAEDLNLDPDAVVGKLIRIWRWFDRHTTDGNAPSVTKKLLDRDVGVTGFTDAMQKHHWIVLKGNTISVPKFDRHNSKPAKNRALGKKRIEKHRNAASVTKALPEKRREEYKNKRVCAPTSARFNEWYAHYPKKKGKAQALKTWKRKKLDQHADTIIADTRKRAEVEWTDPQFIPMASTYINQERWHDEIEVAHTTATVPKDVDACVRFAADRGIQPKPGESMWDFRSRVESSIRTH